jgi:hypothetical protein
MRAQFLDLQALAEPVTFSHTVGPLRHLYFSECGWRLGPGTLAHGA